MEKSVVVKINKKIQMYVLGIISIAALYVYNAKALNPANEEEIKDELSKILNSFELSEKNQNNDFFEMLKEKLIEFLKNLWKKLNMKNKLQKVFGNTKVPDEVMWIFQIIAIILILLIIGLVIYFVVKKYKRTQKVRQEEDALLLDILKDADEVYRRAFDCYSSGDYTQGLRFLYISLLIRLNEYNIIRINKAKTNKQYLLEIRDNKPEIHDAMVEFTSVFNRHWYGRKRADKAVFVNWNDVYSNLINSCN